MPNSELAKLLLQYFGVFGFVIFVVIVLLFFIVKYLWFDRRIVDLQNKNEQELNKLKSELDIYKEKVLKGHIDKIETYRLGADILAETLADLDIMNNTGNLPMKREQLLDPKVQADLRQRGRASLKLYGYLAMYAPQSVMDANEELRDYLDSILFSGIKYEPPKVYQLALKLVNEIRKDVGIDKTPLKYKGTRYKIKS